MAQNIQGVRKVTVHFSGYFVVLQILIHYYSYYNPDMVLTTVERAWLVEHVFQKGDRYTDVVRQRFAEI